MKYPFRTIESKWNKYWLKNKTYEPDLDRAKKPFYNLMMFPYPSAEGLHIGGVRTFTGVDIYGRYKRMSGYDVFEPIGLDGFGIHSENYALKTGQHPIAHAKKSEKNFYRQLGMIGNGFAWKERLETYDPGYYKWTQWIFTEMFRHGLAYRRKQFVNWCPSCKTVLADEQVINGLCERCGSKVEKRNLEQWFFKITNYSEKLLKNLDTLEWSDKVKIAQINWIGKKEGINITYPIADTSETVTVFTTRPDTNFGATFIVLAPENDLAFKISKGKNKKEVEKYIKKSLSKSEEDRVAEGRKKTGVFTGRYAINHLTGKRMPIWVSDFVLGGFGTGAVVGVPGHDIRDFEFAKEFDLKIIRVVVGKDNDASGITRPEQVQEEEGTMVNSGFLDGMDIHSATKTIMDYIEKREWGNRVTTYRLRDWLISRQRYWGPPIPMIYCENCAGKGVGERNDMPGWYAVPLNKLPVLLPNVRDFRPKGTGQSPLANISSFVKVKCFKCGKPARRETDVSDTFLDSAWYFLRYPSANYKQKIWEKSRTKKWLPVNSYIGGAEHAVLHLLYSRFLTMALRDFKLLDFEEPFTVFRAHGLIIKDGTKMSKSKGNVVNPDFYFAKFGADVMRMYLAFLAPFEQGGDFREAGIMGLARFLDRVWNFVNNKKISRSKKGNKTMAKLVHHTIKKVSEDIEQLRYNTAISALMILLNELEKKSEEASILHMKTFLLLLAPFAPYITEELWRGLGEKSSIHKSKWPKYNPELLREDSFVLVVQVNGRVRDSFEAAFGSGEDHLRSIALNRDKIKPYVDGKAIKKVVYVPNKLLNFVV